MSVHFHVQPGIPYFCVVGSPIAHSRSPEIHHAFARQFDLALTYERIEVAPGTFDGALAQFVSAGGRGMNVTVPLKEEAVRAADDTSARARAAGAANVVTVAPGGHTLADNTDGVGLIRDLVTNLGIALRGADVLVLGAGGAARGVIPSLLSERPRAVTIANRTLDRAVMLQRRFGDAGDVRACGYEALPARSFDVVINATSLGLTGAVPPLPAACVGRETVCYDMMYTATGRTAFLDQCGAYGAVSCRDGLGMLVEQAACAFATWHGREPDTGRVIAALRGHSS